MKNNRSKTDSSSCFGIYHCYDGTHFYGWQKSKEGPTIESHLQKALEALLHEQIDLNVASRTDRGVHADEQVANFLSGKNIGLCRESLNSLLPPQIRILRLEKKDLSFHPTLSATKKIYHYYFDTGTVQSPFQMSYSWHIPQPLNLRQMHIVASHLLGTHDFTALSNRREPPHKESICTIHSIVIRPLSKHRWRIEITGDHFLYKMARNIVGTLIYVGLGKLFPQNMRNILASKKREEAGITAPAHGLFLHKVFYEN